jgi:hypothetical protein
VQHKKKTGLFLSIIWSEGKDQRRTQAPINSLTVITQARFLFEAEPLSNSCAPVVALVTANFNTMSTQRGKSVFSD